ncbi:hypothetical protein QE152_g29335 [Popillia japonica]|uniref:Uncharacterized protein n=1 Tax=Popillia japonica TaxID=7064 RepID=A0AAW1JHB9_POPJA
MDPTANYSGTSKRRNGPRQTPPFRGLEIPKSAKDGSGKVQDKSVEVGNVCGRRWDVFEWLAPGFDSPTGLPTTGRRVHVVFWKDIV